MISLLNKSRTAAAMAAGIGGLALAASLPAAASAAPSAAVAHAAKSHVVIVSCRGTGQIRPSNFVITCADGNDYLTGLHWSSWPVNASAGAAAFGRGSEHVNDCIPDCARGHRPQLPGAGHAVALRAAKRSRGAAPHHQDHRHLPRKAAHRHWRRRQEDSAADCNLPHLGVLVTVLSWAALSCRGPTRRC
jgi:hypothetical protein